LYFEMSMITLSTQTPTRQKWICRVGIRHFSEYNDTFICNYYSLFLVLGAGQCIFFHTFIQYIYIYTYTYVICIIIYNISLLPLRFRLCYTQMWRCDVCLILNVEFIWVECLLLLLLTNTSLWSTRYYVPFQPSRTTHTNFLPPVWTVSQPPPPGAPHPHPTVPIRTSWFISFRLYSWTESHSFSL
jgi:hypothetical protein